jgi:hypothetical protein
MRPVADRFHVDGSTDPRPDAPRVIYADGADAGRARRPGEIELSHWVPNATDARYKADTSTEICLRYVADPARESADLVVNDHVDVDGILSLYVLLHPDLALEHADALVGAAEMGDFLAWADRPGFDLAQEVWRHVTSTEGLDPNGKYEAGFRVVTDVLTGRTTPSAATVEGWACLQAGLDLLASGTVATTVASDRLVSFVFPPSIPQSAALGVPVLNQLVDGSIAVWPQARNRDHAQRVQLLSAPQDDGGWFHDLWAPSYSWAETPDRWALPGLVSTGDSNAWLVRDDALTRAVATLQKGEAGAGTWVCAHQLTPFTSIDGRRFPVLVSCVDGEAAPAPSTQSPDALLDVLAPVWSAATAAPARPAVSG